MENKNLFWNWIVTFALLLFPQVKLWRIPEGGMSESLNSPESRVSQEQRRVERVLWHPAAEGVLAVATFKTVNIYDVNTQQAIASKYYRKISGIRLTKSRHLNVFLIVLQ